MRNWTWWSLQREALVLSEGATRFGWAIARTLPAQGGEFTLGKAVATGGLGKRPGLGSAVALGGGGSTGKQEGTQGEATSLETGRSCGSCIESCPWLYLD